ncbi:MAG: hypothetical protein KBD23_01615 [Gammaproteobacteria bacterium]|nr:hypothetical protein [Gammaproteobacteria bacterium]MBP9728823.1 hypothetical protein [Gammaproteobacteria bacterium]
MSCKQDDIEWFREQHKTLLGIRLFFGSDKAVCQAVNLKIEQEKRRGKYMPKRLKRSCFNAWIIKNRLIPYEYAWLLSKVANINLELLYRFQLSEEKDLHLEKKTVILWSIQRVIVPADFYDPITTMVHACILVDVKGVLIYGLSMLRWYQEQGKEQIPVIVVDLDAIKPETPFLENFDFTFSISQRAVMSAVFKKIAPKRQGLRFDLLEKKASELKNIEQGSELDSPGYEVKAKADAFRVAQTTLCRGQDKQGTGPKTIKKRFGLDTPGYEVKGTTDAWMAKTFGFTSKELLVRAQKLYEHAPEWLILAVDKGKVPITKAFRMLNNPQALEACKRALLPVISTSPALSKNILSLKKSQKKTQKKECSDEVLC